MGAAPVQVVGGGGGDHLSSCLDWLEVEVDHAVVGDAHGWKPADLVCSRRVWGVRAVCTPPLNYKVYKSISPPCLYTVRTPGDMPPESGTVYKSGTVQYTTCTYYK